MESYSSHLEPTFLQIPLPPTGPNQSIPPNFDLSKSYANKLEHEFERVYDEYSRRIQTVQTYSEQIISLWAELGIPQSQQDGAIIKYYDNAPEQLGLHQEDIARLRSKRDQLANEKKDRERRLKELRNNVESLWVKLEIDEGETKNFLNQNRGCGIRQINEFQAELSRLTELKKENMHLFVEDARVKLQDLWDALYFSEDEMLDFTPAFSDVYSDALLDAHEREIARLEALKEQRAPILALVDRHRSLIKERDELAASSQDASRLMMRGQKGERRDPGKLLREEKMRKRIAKELPKVAADVRKMLQNWEHEFGREFLVHGEPYLDELEADEAMTAAKKVPTARSKTPAGPPPSATKINNKSVSKPAAPAPAPTPVPTHGPARSQSTRTLPARSMTKTPTTTGGTLKRAQSQQITNTKTSPSKIPNRPPLSNLKHGNNSPERPPRPESRGDTLRNGAPVRAPPPKMRDLVQGHKLETPQGPYKSSVFSSSIVRHVEPEDVYDDRPLSRSMRPDSNNSYYSQYYEDEYDERYSTLRSSRMPPPPRQISSTSQSSTTVSGSENWETYDDFSEPEPDASDAYFAKVRAAQGKRTEPEHGLSSSQNKRAKGIPPQDQYGIVQVDEDGRRVVSGSEWTDEDAY